MSIRPILLKHVRYVIYSAQGISTALNVQTVEAISTVIAMLRSTF